MRDRGRGRSLQEDDIPRPLRVLWEPRGFRFVCGRAGRGTRDREVPLDLWFSSGLDDEGAENREEDKVEERRECEGGHVSKPRLRRALALEGPGASAGAWEEKSGPDAVEASRPCVMEASLG